MNKTKIEWCDYTINPVKGLCPMACSYCYALRMYKRFKWNPELRYNPSAWLGLGSLRKPSRIFVGSTMELFGNFIKPEWVYWILELPYEFPQHTFIFLTKQPQFLSNWEPFPENCWVGVTITNQNEWDSKIQDMYHVVAPVRFISFEPLLGHITPYFIKANVKPNFDWLIIGQQTPISAKTQPKIEMMQWIQEIVQTADKAGIPVFLKDNLRPLINTLSATEALPFYDSQTCELRQEFPIVKTEVRT